MAIYAASTFESGQPDGTAVSTANSGSPAGRAFDQLAGTVAYSTAQLWHGRLTGKFDQVATTSAQARWVDAANTAGTCYARWYMYITAAPSAATRVMHFALANGTQELAIRLKTDRHMDLLDSASAIMATSTTVIPTNAWVRFEAKMVPSATVGQGELKIFTTPDSTTPTETLTSTAAWNTGSAGSGMWRWGPTTGAAATYTLWMDDVAIAFDAYIGPSVDARSGTGSASAATTLAGAGSKGSAGSGSATLATGTTDGGTKQGAGSGTTSAATGTTSTGAKRGLGNVTLTASTASAGTGTHTGSGMGTTLATANTTAAGTHAGTGSAALSATTGLAGAGGKVLAGTGALGSLTGLAGAGQKRGAGMVALSAIVGSSAAGTARRYGTGSLAALVALTGLGRAGAQDLSHLSGTARVRIYSGKAVVRGLTGTARPRRYDGEVS